MAEINPRVARAAMLVAFDAAEYTWLDLSEQDASREDLHPYALEQASFSVAKMPLLFERMAIIPPLANWSDQDVFTLERVNGRIKVTGWLQGQPDSGFRVELFDEEGGEYAMLVDFDPERVLPHFQQDRRKAADWCKQNTVEMMVNLHYASTAKRGAPEYYSCPTNPANAKRRRKGKTPLYEWKTIVIDATIRKRIAAAVRAAKPREPQREHGVRGHWAVRKKSGKRYWVRAHKRGDASKGTIFHDYTTQGERR
jgi:hypothetical protein